MKTIFKAIVAATLSLIAYNTSVAQDGDNCENAIDLSSITSPATFSTLGMNSDLDDVFSATWLAPDMFFYIDVPAGHALTIGQSENDYDSRNQLRKGSYCPGDSLIDDWDTEDTDHKFFSNNSPQTVRVYWIQGGYSSYQGSFTLEWSLVKRDEGNDCSGAICLDSIQSPALFTTEAVDASNLMNRTSNDMVFYKDVKAGDTLVIRQARNYYDSYHYLSIGDACPGDSIIKAVDEPETQHAHFINNSTSTRRAFWVQSGYNTSARGAFVLEWTNGNPGGSASLHESWYASTYTTDNDNDGFRSLMHMYVTAKSNYIIDTASLYAGLYYMSAEENTYRLYGYTALFDVYPMQTSTTQNFIIKDIPHGVYSLRLVLFGADSVAVDTMDVDKQKFENASEDLNHYINIVSWDTLVDRDNDGYFQRKTMRFVLYNGEYDDQKVFVKIFMKQSDSSVFKLLHTTDTFTSYGFDFSRSFYVRVDSLPHNSYDFMLKLFTSEGNLISTYDFESKKDFGLSEQKFELAIEELLHGGPGDKCSNAIDLASISSPATFDNTQMNIDFRDLTSLSWGHDMIFFIDVPAGQTFHIGQPFFSFDTRHIVRKGNECPGNIELFSGDEPEIKTQIYTNNSESTERLYWIQSGKSSSYNGAFSLQWGFGNISLSPSTYTTSKFNATDLDYDGWLSSAEISISIYNPTLTNKTLKCKLLHKKTESSTFLPLAENTPFTATANSHTNSQVFHISGLDKGLYDFMIELYDDKDSIIDSYNTSTDRDSSLYKQAYEPLQGDLSHAIYTSSWYSSIDNDNDRLFSSKKLRFYTNNLSTTADTAYLVVNIKSKKATGYSFHNKTELFAAKASSYSDYMYITVDSLSKDTFDLQLVLINKGGDTLDIYGANDNNDLKDQVFEAVDDDLIIGGPGDNCSSAIDLSSIKSPASFDTDNMNTDLSSTSSPISWGRDMVFFIDVPAGQTFSIQKTASDFDSYYSLSTGGECPGEKLVKLVDSPEDETLVYSNNGNSSQRAYWVVAGYNPYRYGSFTIKWSMGEESGTDSLSSIMWQNVMDIDLDGYASSSSLTFKTFNSSTIPHTLTAKVWVVNPSSGSYELHASVSSITCNPLSYSGLQSVKFDDMATGSYDLKIELLDQAGNIVDTRSFENNNDLKQVMREPIAEDEYHHISSAYWKSRKNLDGDDYLLSQELAIYTSNKKNSNEYVYAKLLYKNSADTAYKTYARTDSVIAYAGHSANLDDIVVKDLPRGSYDFILLLLNSKHQILDTYTSDDNEQFLGQLIELYREDRFESSPGDDCQNAINLDTLTSPSLFTNSGKNIDFDTLQSTIYWGRDMVMFIDVPPGKTLSIGQSENTFDSKHRVSIGNSCPGDSVIDLIDEPEITSYRYTNNSLVSKRLFWIEAGYSLSSTGTFELEWGFANDSNSCLISSVSFTNPAADTDGDGYASMIPMNIYINNPNGFQEKIAVRIFARLSGSSSFSEMNTSQNHTVEAMSTYRIAHDLTGLPHGEYEFKVELYNQTGLMLHTYSYETSNNTEMLNVKLELDEEETSHEVYSTSLTDFIDVDGDSYARGAALKVMTFNKTPQSDSAYIKVYHKALSATTYTCFHTSSSLLMMPNATSSSFFVEINSLPTGAYDFQIELYNSIGKLLDTYNYETDFDQTIHNRKFELASTDQNNSGDGDNCSNAINLANIISPATYNSEGMNIDFNKMMNTSSWGPDMVFFIDLAPGFTFTVGQTYNSFDTRHALLSGGDCPGKIIFGPIDEPELDPVVYVNSSDTSVRLFWIVGGYSPGSTGSFSFAWSVKSNAGSLEISSASWLLEQTDNDNDGYYSSKTISFNVFNSFSATQSAYAKVLFKNSKNSVYSHYKTTAAFATAPQIPSAYQHISISDIDSGSYDFLIELYDANNKRVHTVSDTEYPQLKNVKIEPFASDLKPGKPHLVVSATWNNYINADGDQYDASRTLNFTTFNQKEQSQTVFAKIYQSQAGKDSYELLATTATFSVQANAYSAPQSAHIYGLDKHYYDFKIELYNTLNELQSTIDGSSNTNLLLEGFETSLEDKPSETGHKIAVSSVAWKNITNADNDAFISSADLFITIYNASKNNDTVRCVVKYRNASGRTFSVIDTTKKIIISQYTSNSSLSVQVNNLNQNRYDFSVEVINNLNEVIETYNFDITSAASEINDIGFEPLSSDNNADINAFISNATVLTNKDADSDGFAQSRTFEVSITTDSSTSIPARIDLWYKKSSDTSYSFLASSNNIDINSLSAHTTSITIDTLPLGVYDFEIKLTASNKTLDSRETHALKCESTATDTIKNASVAISNMYWDSPIDNDQDGYPCSQTLSIIASTNIKGKATIKLYYLSSASNQYTMLTDTSVIIDIQNKTFSFVVDNLPRNLYSFKVECFDSFYNTTEIVDYLSTPSLSNVKFEVEKPTSTLPDSKSSVVNIFPIPADDVLTLMLPYTCKGFIIINDMLGKHILTQKFEGTTIFVNLKELTGMYLIKIHTPIFTSTHKIICN